MNKDMIIYLQMAEGFEGFATVQFPITVEGYVVWDSEDLQAYVKGEELIKAGGDPYYFHPGSEYTFSQFTARAKK